MDPLSPTKEPSEDIGHGQLLSLGTSLRNRSAAATLEAIAQYRRELQILDLIDHTLEAIPSIPIYEAVRTSSPAGYFCLGKGFSHEASMASALMEATEMAFVEDPRITPESTLGTLPGNALICRPGWPEPLPQSSLESSLDPSTPMLKGTSLIDDLPLFIPVMDLFYGHGRDGTKHGPSTNGLASGNTWNEALVHGLCELLERDALQRWMLRSLFFPPELIPLDHDATWDQSLRAGLEQIQADGLHVVLTRLPCKHSVTVFEAQLIRHVADGRVLAFTGWGCHANGLIATKRAIAESVQILATHVAIRDGRIPPERLPGSTSQQRLRGQALGQQTNFECQLKTSLRGMRPRLWTLKCGPDESFSTVPSCRNEQELLALLKGEQLGNAFCVQVSPPEWPIVALRCVGSALRTPAGL